MTKVEKTYCAGGQIAYQAGLHAVARPLRDPDLAQPDDDLGVWRFADALVELQQLTERLRRDCPWDREQTERTIVPHTVEEAYEVADAALAGDDAKLLDELGDLLFQAYLPRAAALRARRGRPRGGRARASTPSSSRRHPHVFGDAEVDDRRRACAQNWERLKVDQEAREGVFHDVPGRCRRSCSRARCSGAPPRSASTTPTSPARFADLEDELASCGRSCRRRPSAEARARPAGGRRARRRALRLRQRRADAQRRSRARAARRDAALPRPGRGRRSGWRRRTARTGSSCRSPSRTATSTAPKESV